MAIRLSGLTAALLLIAGCGGPASDNQASGNQSGGVNNVSTVSDEAAREPSNEALAELENASANLADAALMPNGAVPASAPDPSLVSRDWFAGGWTDTGNCAEAGQFTIDGRYRLADGTRGMWNVTESRLVVQNLETRNVVQLRRIDDNTVEVIGQDGSVGRSTRC